MGGPVNSMRGRKVTPPLTLAADSVFSFLDIPDLRTTVTEGRWHSQKGSATEGMEGFCMACPKLRVCFAVGCGRLFLLPHLLLPPFLPFRLLFSSLPFVLSPFRALGGRSHFRLKASNGGGESFDT